MARGTAKLKTCPPKFRQWFANHPHYDNEVALIVWRRPVVLIEKRHRGECKSFPAEAALPFRHDAFKAEFARLGEHDSALGALR